MSLVKAEKFEIHKPSELCQVVFYEDYDKGIIAKMHPTQLDILNAIMYSARQQLEESKVDISKTRIVDVEISLREIMHAIGKYENGQYRQAFSQLCKLKRLDVMINTMGKVKGTVNNKLTNFIHELDWTTHGNTVLKKVQVAFNGPILHAFFRKKKGFFSVMFLSIQYDMNSKYSKLLYELLRDYINIRNLTVDFDTLKILMNVDSTKNVSTWSIFRPSILEKAINEINEKSDINIDYEPIKEKLEGQRLQVTKLKFSFRPQPKKRLNELGLTINEKGQIVENKFGKTPEEVEKYNKYYHKSKDKLYGKVKNGYKVDNEEAWIMTDIKNYEDRYESEIKIDTWLNDTDHDFKNDVYETMVQFYDKCDDPAIVIEDYKLVGLYSKDIFTRNPEETIEQLNTVLTEVYDVQE